MHPFNSLSTLSTLELKSANLWFPKTGILSTNIPYCNSSVSQSFSSTLPEISSNVKIFLNLLKQSSFFCCHHYWIQKRQMADKRVQNWTFLRSSKRLVLHSILNSIICLSLLEHLWRDSKDLIKRRILASLLHPFHSWSCYLPHQGHMIWCWWEQCHSRYRVSFSYHQKISSSHLVHPC